MLYGEIIAILTAFCWAISSSIFEESGKKIGSFNLNLTRLLFAFVFIATYNFFVNGMILPLNATPEVIIFMAISGIFGIFLGDMMLFEAYVLLSARVTLLIMFLVPPLTSLLSFIFLGDKMLTIEIVGMIVIIFGIYLVVSSKGDKTKTELSKKGIAFAFGSTLMQSISNVVSKHSVAEYDAFLSAEIRIIAGLLAFCILYTFKGHWGTYLKTFSDKKVLTKIGIGSFFGPFLGIALTLVSLQYISAGVSSTLSSMSPIILIPYVTLIKKEKITKNDIIGTIVAFFGLLLII